MKDNDLLARLVALETELHRLETRRNRSRLEQLLHADFVEVARSGRRYSRAEVLEEFSPPAAALAPVHAEQFELVRAGPKAVLLTYVSAHRTATGAPKACTSMPPIGGPTTSDAADVDSCLAFASSSQCFSIKVGT